MASLAECLTPESSSPEAFLRIAEEKAVDLTIVGPEAPLVAGVADAFRARGRRIVGPTAAAARLEGSKAFSKAFMQRAGVPTARAETVDRVADIPSVAGSFSYPVVLKADGLAAGKGVIIVQQQSELAAAMEALPAGRVVVEEYLQGEEVSFIVLCHDGRVFPLETTQDHKPVFDGDQGPNTGGMGAYCDTRILTGAQRQDVMRRIVDPTLDRMEAGGEPFSGFLYVGLMMTAGGPKVLEYNVRLGDPETQPLMFRMTSDFLATLADGAPMEWSPDPSVCVVMAAKGYPGTPHKGAVIRGLDTCGATVFQGGTKSAPGGIVTSGGRVLGVTASGPDLQQAIDNAYQAVDKIHFDGMHFRRDIGRKGLRRW